MNNEKDFGGKRDAQTPTKAEEVLGSEPSFEEHMKQMRGKEEMHIEISPEEVAHAKEEIDRRMKNGENYVDIMGSFPTDLQKQLYASWTEKTPPIDEVENPPVEYDEFQKIEAENRRSHSDDLDASSRADMFNNGNY